jgi:dsDNA-specific endonuclease/ATPase MutS2
VSWWNKLRARDSRQPPEAADEDSTLNDAPDDAGQFPVALQITDVLDLHVFAPRDVSEVVRTYLDEARAKGFATVRIIHGKGIGTQRTIVQSILDKTPFVASYQGAPAEAGGWGATVVWFKK